MQHKIPAVFMRGGTSRAVFFREDVMAPYDQVIRDNIILTALGSPDPDGRQIDGLGGGISSLSKAAIIGRSANPAYDVTFNFAQVDVKKPFVDWSGTCGNMSAAVAACSPRMRPRSTTSGACAGPISDWRCSGRK